MVDDGYVKYKSVWTRSQPVSKHKIHDILVWREELYQKNLVGAYDNGVGFGNISQRIPHTNEFCITGTATGNESSLTPNHISIVHQVNIDENYLECIGPIRASSEAMTHAAIYLTDPEIQAVIHIHNLALWDALYDAAPTTHPKAEYGTPLMAHEIAKIVTEYKKKKRKPLIIMAGHTEGIIAYGKTMDDAAHVILRELAKIGDKVTHVDIHEDEHEA
ncbi:MAG: class II aldolase/adducin family protein [Candidatus Woesearchaeota archaeon]